MIHSTDTCERIGTFRDGRPIWRCPACGAEIVGERLGGECGPSKPPSMDCIHRRPSVVMDRVPCGACATSGRPKIIPVVLCTFGGGRACSLVDVGRGDVVDCSRCGDRRPPG